MTRSLLPSKTPPNRYSYKTKVDAVENINKAALAKARKRPAQLPASSMELPAESPRASAASARLQSPAEAPEAPIAASPGPNGPLEPENAQLLRLKLKTLDERVFELQASRATPVSAFREQVAGLTQVPAARQRLIYRGNGVLQEIK